MLPSFGITKLFSLLQRRSVDPAKLEGGVVRQHTIKMQKEELQQKKPYTSTTTLIIYKAAHLQSGSLPAGMDKPKTQGSLNSLLFSRSSMGSLAVSCVGAVGVWRLGRWLSVPTQEKRNPLSFTAFRSDAKP